MGDHCWIVAGMPAEQKQLIRASQIAAHKTPSAPESPLSLCYVTDRERRGEWDCACAQNLNTCCFVSCGQLTSACVLKAVMADWNCFNHFDTLCIFSVWCIFDLLNFSGLVSLLSWGVCYHDTERRLEKNAVRRALCHRERSNNVLRCNYRRCSRS